MNDVTKPLGTPIRGVTLYSFTRFFHGRQLSFAELVREVAKHDLGPGIEIVGFQSIRNFPNVSDEFVHDFRSLIDETGLVPTALGANTDAGLRRDRRLTEEELFEYHVAQLEVARKLGFPLIRAQHALEADDIERLLPTLDRLDLTLGIELHAYHSAGHPTFQALLERFDKIGSPRLGFIPDWGATMDRVPRSLLQTYRDRGVSEQLVTDLDTWWDTKHLEGAVMDDATQGQRFEEVVRLAKCGGADELAIEMAVNLTALFGHATVDSWSDIIAWAVHTHGKFYEIDAPDSPTVPIDEIIRLYVESGYSRTISTEWEGFHWNTTDSPFDIISAEHRALERAAEAAGSRIVSSAEEARALMKRELP